MNIRDAGGTDWDALVSVYNLARASVDCFPSGTISRKKFKSICVNEEIQVADAGGQVVGFVSIWPPEKFVHHLYVHPEFQNEGIAVALIGACIRRYGLPLSLKSLVANAGACRFYAKNSWVVRETGYGTDGAYNHYWLSVV